MNAVTSGGLHFDGKKEEELGHPLMSLTVTAWRLLDPSGRRIRCLVSERDGRWQVILWHGPSIVLWERQATDDAALERATELWRIFVKQGWRETSDAVQAGRYRRECPECHRQAASAIYRRYGDVVLFCENCEHGWTDRDRIQMADRRHFNRYDGDRRKAS